MASGLEYLHGKGVTHRDLKPPNVLVSNQHYYCQLFDHLEIETISSKMPIVCKLTDFGESRSQDIHTNTVLSSKTSRVSRGTLVFMAPEILVNDFQLPVASLDDLKRVDMWAYGMVLFNLINPGLKHPFQINMQTNQFAGKTPLQLLEKFARSKEKPIHQRKYAEKQASEWQCLANIYESCTVFEPSLRPSAKDVTNILSKVRNLTMQREADTASEEVAVCESKQIYLTVCQTSFIESLDRHVLLNNN